MDYAKNVVEKILTKWDLNRYPELVEDIEGALYESYQEGALDAGMDRDVFREAMKYHQKKKNEW